MQVETKSSPFGYFNINEVDPNYETLPADVYVLRVLKFEAKTTRTGKDYVAATFAVTGHPQYSGRRLWHNFWDISPASRDAKNLRRFQLKIGIEQTGDFSGWLDEVSQVQPTVKASVGLRKKTLKNAQTGEYELVVNEQTGEPEQENYIDFRSIDAV